MTTLRIAAAVAALFLATFAVTTVVLLAPLMGG